jgi:putative ABC transport system permease protein
MRLVGAVAVLLRRLRAERGIALALFVLVGVTSLVVAISPRLFERVADEGLRYELERGTAVQRNIQFSLVDRIRAGDVEPMEFLQARGETLLRRLPASVRAVIGARDFVVETPRFDLIDAPNYPTFITLRYGDGVAGRLSVVEGRAPAAVEPPADDEAPPRFEIALSTDTARELGLGLGDALPAVVDPADPLLRALYPRPTTEIELALVGLFTVVDPDDPAWFDDPAYARPAISISADESTAFATALFAPAAYVDLAALDLPGRYRWRYRVDVARLDAGRLKALIPDLRRLETTFGSNPSVPGNLVYGSGLLEIIDRYLARRATTEAVLSVAAIGPLAVAAAALGLVAAIIIRRRRAVLALARGRGASAGQLLAAQLWEGLLITVPAALVGLVAARVAVPARSDPVSSIGAVLVAITVTALLLLATWPGARRARRTIERDDAPARRFAPRRIVFEATIVLVALTAAWLLRERGLGSARPGTTATGFDPLLAAAPVLIGVAIALVTIRLYPFPVRALAWLSARRRDLVPALGLRAIGRDPGAANLPLLVVTMTVAIGVFSSVLEMTIERGQVAASWQEVGADYRLDAVTGSGFAPETDPSVVPGVEAVAPALVTTTTRASGDIKRVTPATFVAVDPTAYAAVLAGAPVAMPGLARLANAPTDARAGTPDQPIPVVISTKLPPGWPPLAIGETFRIGLGAQAFSFAVVDVADDLPGSARGAPFILAPFDALAAGRVGRELRPTVVFIRGPRSIGADLRAAVSGPTVELSSRHELLAARRADPLVGAISRGFGIAGVAAATYAALAVVAVIVLDAQRRARELAFLRTLGLTSRQSVTLTFVEHAPPAVLALAVGIALGLGVAWLLEPGLGLGAFVGPATPVRLYVDWLAVVAIAGTVLGVIVLMVTASSWLARRLEPSQALRIGDG